MAAITFLVLSIMFVCFCDVHCQAPVAAQVVPNSCNLGKEERPSGSGKWYTTTVPTGCEFCWFPPERSQKCLGGNKYQENNCPSGKLCKESPKCVVSCVSPEEFSNSQGVSNNQQQVPNNQEVPNNPGVSNDQGNSNNQQVPNNQGNSNNQQVPNDQGNSNNQQAQSNRGVCNLGKEERPSGSGKWYITTVPTGCQFCWYPHEKYQECMPDGKYQDRTCPSGQWCKESPTCKVTCVPPPDPQVSNNE
jgi:hypothetical protein